MRFFLSMAILLWVAELCHAQWNWEPKGDHLNSVCRISTPKGSGTGIVISKYEENGSHYGQVLTAAHVIEGSENSRNIKVRFASGKGSDRCKVIKQNRKFDVAVLLSWVPEEIVPAKVSALPAVAGDKLTAAGLGGEATTFKTLRYFRVVADDPTDPTTVFAPESLLAGDSGGPVFNSNLEVVGVISGGWLWYMREDRPATWPFRSCNSQAVVNLLSGSKK